MKEVDKVNKALDDPDRFVLCTIIHDDEKVVWHEKKVIF